MTFRWLWSDRFDAPLANQSFRAQAAWCLQVAVRLTIATGVVVGAGFLLWRLLS